MTILDLRGRRPSLTTLADGLAEPVSGAVRDGQVIVVESLFGILFGKRGGQATEPFAQRSIALPAPPAEAAVTGTAF